MIDLEVKDLNFYSHPLDHSSTGSNTWDRSRSQMFKFLLSQLKHSSTDLDTYDQSIS